MERVAEVVVRFEFAQAAGVSFSDALELSLDCPVCRRCMRTVIFCEGHAEGKCTPTGHAFPGRIIGKQVSQVGAVWSVVYRVAYHYGPFTDAKHPGERQPSGRPTWGRVPFEVVCPECGRVNKASTQSNIGRPWSCRCQCGCALYTERELMPVLSSAEAPEE